MKYVLLAIVAGLFFGCASTSRKLNQPTIMIGEVSDDISTHDTRHEHELSFKNQETGEVFKVAENLELKKLHESGKNYLIEANVVRTSKFLFWDGKLVVKSFNVIKETSDEIPHRVYQDSTRRTPSMHRLGTGRSRL